MSRFARIALALTLLATLSCNIPETLTFMAPGTGQLSQTGPVTVSLALPEDGDVATLVVTMDGVDVTAQLPAPIAGIRWSARSRCRRRACTRRRR